MRLAILILFSAHHAFAQLSTPVQVRSALKAFFYQSNPILALGEPAYETDTGLLKFGDGTNAYALLPYGGTGGAQASTASEYFGNGKDGDLTVSAGQYLMLGNMYFHDLTISGTGSLRTANWMVFVSGTLYLDNCPANGITYAVTNGNNASGATAGASVSAETGQSGNGTFPAQIASQNGANGGTGNGAQGGTAATQSPCNAGYGGASGAGGNDGGGSRTGGAARTVGSSTQNHPGFFNPLPIRGVSNWLGAGWGAGGSAGAGDGTNAGGGGGSTGNQQGQIYIAAKRISRGGSTSAGCISANAANSGNGANGVAGTAGGGGGAGGNGGGFILVQYESLTGTTATNIATANGGNGGNGGNGASTGKGGGGGQGGSSGRILFWKTGDQTYTESVPAAGTAGNAASGSTGGSGGAGATGSLSL